MTKKPLLIFFLILIFLPLLLAGEDNPDIVFFYGDGCKYYSNVNGFLKKLNNENPNLNIQEYEVYNNKENQMLFLKMTSAYGKKAWVPAVFIGDQVTSGYNYFVEKTIKDEIQRCQIEECLKPMEKLREYEEWQSMLNNPNQINSTSISQRTNKNSNMINGIPIPKPLEEIKNNTKKESKVVRSNEIIYKPPQFQKPKEEFLEVNLWNSVYSGLKDIFRSCSLGIVMILIFLVSSLRTKSDALKLSLTFSTAVFLMHLFMGFNFFSFLILPFLVRRIAYLAISSSATSLGVYKIIAYFGRSSGLLESSLGLKYYLKKITNILVTIPGSVFMGILSALLLLPCNYPQKIAILNLFHTSKVPAIFYLILYSLSFVIPLFLIGLISSLFLLKKSDSSDWSSTKLEFLNLILGIILLIFGLWIFLNF